MASTPPTIAFLVSTPADFIAWIAPIAISSLLETTASNFSPFDSQLVIRFCALRAVPVGGLLGDDLDAVAWPASR